MFNIHKKTKLDKRRQKNDKTNYTIRIQPFLLRFEINRRRLIYLAFGAAAFLIAYSTGAAVPMSEEEAETLTREFSKQIEGIDQNGIFLNNIRITLIMFVPAVGSAFGAFSGFATGSIFSALASSTPMLGEVPPLVLLITPFLKRMPWRKYTIPTLIELGIAAGVLFVAAVIEWQMIEQLGGLDASIAIDPMVES